MKLGLAWLYFLHGYTVVALTAYDCARLRGTSSYRLPEIDHCSPLDEPPLKEEVIDGHLLEVVASYEVPGRVCALEVVSKAAYCSYDRHYMEMPSAANMAGFQSEFISAPACRTWWDTGVATGPWGSVDVIPGRPVLVEERGQVTADGWCAAWSTQGIFRHYRLSISHVSLTAVPNIGDAKRPDLYLGPTKVETADGADHGTVDGATVLFSAAGVRVCPLVTVVSPTLRRMTLKDGSVWFSATEQSVALRASSGASVCGLQLRATQHPHLYVSVGDLPRLDSIPNAKRGHLSSLLMTEAGFSLLHNAIGVASVTAQTQANLCRLEVGLRRVALTDAGLDPETLGYRLFGKPGYTVTTAGEGIRVGTCSALEVKVAPQDKCYRDVPVQLTDAHALWFMRVPEHTLHQSSLEVTCDDPAVPVFSLGGVYHELSPRLRVLSRLPELPSDLTLTPTNLALPNASLYDDHVVVSLERDLTAWARTYAWLTDWSQHGINRGSARSHPGPTVYSGVTDLQSPQHHDTLVVVALGWLGVVTLTVMVVLGIQCWWCCTPGVPSARLRASSRTAPSRAAALLEQRIREECEEDSS